MEEFIEEYDVEPAETDEEYEFEASQFYDFTRPESDYEIEEAERWFELSGDYPPSPFIVKLNLKKLLSVEVVANPNSKEKHSNSKSISSSSDTDSRHGVSIAKKNAKGKSYITGDEDSRAKVKTNSSSSAEHNKLVESRSTPSFMEPTASHLAKQKVNHKHSSAGHICTRFQKTSGKLDQKGSQQSSSPIIIGFDNIATKRQKLDIGYSRKVAHLKHQFLLMHKSSKKVTIPKEPELETMLRAQRRRSKNSCASSCSETSHENQKQKCCNFKAHPLNKKILEPRLSLQPKKSPPRLPKFQVFNLRTMERANHHASAKVYPAGVTDIDGDIIQNTKQKSTILLREESAGGSSTGDRFLESPPTEQFSKLSLGSDHMMKNSSSASQSGTSSSLKGQKKGDCDPFQAEFWRCNNAKPNKQCGGHMRRFHEAKCWSDMSRSLDIR